MKILPWFLGVIAFLITSQPVTAGYVLPYPSYMPSHRLYRFSRWLDSAKALWYWGSIASFKYHLALSDKYLVEAKTLFEYGQYLLAVDALKRSTEQIRSVPEFIQKANSDGKDTKQLRLVLSEAMITHIQALEGVKLLIPTEFLWQPEKQGSTRLPLVQLLNEAINDREKTLHAQ